MAGLVQGMALVVYPDASITTLWQTTLLMFAFLLLAFSVNIFLDKYLPAIENIMVLPASLQDAP